MGISSQNINNPYPPTSSPLPSLDYQQTITSPQIINILNKFNNAYNDHFGYIKNSYSQYTQPPTAVNVFLPSNNEILPSYQDTLAIKNKKAYDQYINPTPQKKQNLLDFINELWGQPSKIVQKAKNLNKTKTPDDEKAQKRKKWIIAGLIGAGVLILGIWAKRNNIADKLVKKFDGKTETREKGKPIRIKSDNIENFNSYCEKLNNSNASSKVPLQDCKVILRNEDVETKKESLENLFQAQKAYCDREIQPRVTLIMSEKVKDEAPAIADYFAKNRIDELPDYYMKEIEGFKIVGLKNQKFNRSELIVTPEVRSTTNTAVFSDIKDKWNRNIINRTNDFFV